MTETTTIETLAAEAVKWFETSKRENGDPFWVQKRGVPKWVTEMVHDAHGSMLPDDHRYAFIVEALCALEADGEDATLEADIYTHDLTNWLGSRADRIGYVDEALESSNAGTESGIVALIQLGQFSEKMEVLDLVREFLETRLGSLEEAAEEASTAPDEADEE